MKLCDVPVGQSVRKPGRPDAIFTVLEHIEGRSGPHSHLVRLQPADSPYEETENGQADVDPVES